LGAGDRAVTFLGASSRTHWSQVSHVAHVPKPSSSRFHSGDASLRSLRAATLCLLRTWPWFCLALK